MKRAQNWNQPCPNRACSDYGQQNQGNVLSIATYLTQGGQRRIFACRACGKQFSETRDTVFFDLHTPDGKVMMALKMILVRVSTESEGQQESPPEAEDGRQWVWVSYAPEFRLMLATVVGPRTYETALQLIERTARIVLGSLVFPRLLTSRAGFSDGFSCYLAALVECYHTLKFFPRTGKPGRPRKPVKEPHPDLVYGQLIEKNRKGRVRYHHSRCLWRPTLCSTWIDHQH